MTVHMANLALYDRKWITVQQKELGVQIRKSQKMLGSANQKSETFLNSVAECLNEHIEELNIRGPASPLVFFSAPTKPLQSYG